MTNETCCAAMKRFIASFQGRVIAADIADKQTAHYKAMRKADN